MMASVGADVYGATLYEGMERGLTRGDAQKRAAVAALAEGATEMIPAKVIIGLGKGTWAKGWQSIAKAAAYEGAQEAMVEGINMAADASWNRIFEGGLPGWERKSFGEIVADMGYASVVGAGAGGTLRTGAMAMESAARKLTRSQRGEDPTEDPILEPSPPPPPPSPEAVPDEPAPAGQAQDDLVDATLKKFQDDMLQAEERRRQREAEGAAPDLTRAGATGTFAPGQEPRPPSAGPAPGPVAPPVTPPEDLERFEAGKPRPRCARGARISWRRPAARSWVLSGRWCRPTTWWRPPTRTA